MLPTGLRTICLFISFFQLCYRISERGITLLLNFLRALLLWIANFQSSAELLTLREIIPRNVYFLKKMYSSEGNMTIYAVCPKCHSLYNLEDCVVRQRSGLVESVKCKFVQYPNHPHASRRENCNALLMKRTKYGSPYWLVPRKVYIYNNLKASITKLFAKTGFSYNCKMWRNRLSMYSDI